MIILSSPSGAGKTTLVKLLSERKGFVTSISHTTRTPRSNEVDGRDYYFVNNEKFEEMIKNKSGKIINITSVVGHTGNVGQANYAASKSGIIGMSKSLALEYAKKNININCISPGFIKTNMTEKIDPKFKELILAKIPSNRLGEPSDVANVAAFLSSEMSNYITGETIHVNGGMYLG